jgi:hypothetical protein
MMMLDVVPVGLWLDGPPNDETRFSPNNANAIEHVCGVAERSDNENLLIDGSRIIDSSAAWERREHSSPHAAASPSFQC